MRHFLDTGDNIWRPRKSIQTINRLSHTKGQGLLLLPPPPNFIPFILNLFKELDFVLPYIIKIPSRCRVFYSFGSIKLLHFSSASILALSLWERKL